MTLPEFRQKLQHLESQKISLDNEILQTKREIEKLSPFSKEQKIELFKSLFIGRSDVFSKYNAKRNARVLQFSKIKYKKINR